MSAADDLREHVYPDQNGRAATAEVNKAAALKAMTEMLKLDQHGVSIKDVRLVGNGSKASVDVVLSNGETVFFPTVREMAIVKNFATEMTMAVGRRVSPDNATVLEVIGLLKRAAAIERTATDDDVAISWGLDYLQAARSKILTIDFNDQAERWAAFRRLDEYREPAGAGLLVLEHTDGTLYVRTGWFTSYVRGKDTRAGDNAAIAVRMERVGWSRRGRQGRIKATNPTMPESLTWAFFVVPPDWVKDVGEGAEEVTK